MLCNSAYSLLRTLRKERSTILSLMSLGLSASQSIDVLTHPAIGAAFSTSKSDGPARGLITLESLGELFDASDRREGSDLILYWNDLEKDSRYKGWQSSLQVLFQQPAYPGQIPQLKRNIVNVVIAMNLVQRDCHAILADNIAQFVNRGVAVRFGMVPIVNEVRNDTLGPFPGSTSIKYHELIDFDPLTLKRHFYCKGDVAPSPTHGQAYSHGFQS